MAARGAERSSFGCIKMLSCWIGATMESRVTFLF
jgi:hypothetical protein